MGRSWLFRGVLPSLVCTASDSISRQPSLRMQVNCTLVADPALGDSDDPYDTDAATDLSAPTERLILEQRKGLTFVYGCNGAHPVERQHVL